MKQVRKQAIHIFGKSILAEHTASAKTQVAVFVMWAPGEPGGWGGMSEPSSASQVREVLESQAVQPYSSL